MGKKMKYLIFDEGKITEISWKNPRIIDDFWFGDSASNCRLHADVFPDTPKAREELSRICALYKAVEDAKNTLLVARLKLGNANKRGELG